MGKSELKISSDPHLCRRIHFVVHCLLQQGASKCEPPHSLKSNFYTQVSLETDELRRRRLEARTGFSLTRPVTEALQQFEKHLSSLAPPNPSKPVRR